jgi:CheY-like chemotaxis protein
MRVFYVDDDRINGLLFEEACRMAGDVDVQVVVDGAEALDLARRWVPDIFVVDLNLPDTNGFALVAALRGLPACESVPAFLCTADESDEVRARAAELGFAGCWTKPIELRSMLAALAQFRHRAGA